MSYVGKRKLNVFTCNPLLNRHQTAAFIKPATEKHNRIIKTGEFNLDFASKKSVAILQ